MFEPLNVVKVPTLSLAGDHAMKPMIVIENAKSK